MLNFILMLSDYVVFKQMMEQPMECCEDVEEKYCNLMNISFKLALLIFNRAYKLINT